MLWLVAFAVVIAVLGYFVLRADDRQKNAQPSHTIAEPPARTARAPQAETTPTATTLHSAPAAPITTQKDACQLLSALLASRTGRPLRGAAADLRQEMKEHADELRSNIDFLREEVSNKKEYREVIAENFQDHLDEEGDGLDPDDEGIARTRRHLGHLDREIAEMQAALRKHQAALKAFRADRTAFVHSFAAHLLDGTPSPNVARNPDAGS